MSKNKNVASKAAANLSYLNPLSERTVTFDRAHQAALESIVSNYAPPGFLLTEDGVVVHIFGDAGNLISMRPGSFSTRIIDLIIPELKLIVAQALEHGTNTASTNFNRTTTINRDDNTAACYQVSLIAVETPNKLSQELRHEPQHEPLSESQGEANRFQLLLLADINNINDTQTPITAIASEQLISGGLNPPTDSPKILQQRIAELEYKLQSSEEHQYRCALEDIFQVISDSSAPYSQKLQRILEIGLDYYQMSTGMVGMIIGDTYHVKSISSKEPLALNVENELPLNQTFASFIDESEAFMALDCVSESHLNGLPCHSKSGIESFIGATINSTNGPYGVVSFSALKPRATPYSTQDETFALLIGSWIGFLVGNLEQIEFMENQSEYYQSLFATVPAMMFLSDANGLIISCSDRLGTKLGVDPDLLPGKICHREFKVDDKEGLKALLANGEAYHFPITLTLPDDSTLEVELNCSIKSVGALQGVRMVVLKDVSDRNKAAREVEDQNRLLESANENLNQFAFIASHDLQEPLRKIQQFSSFLEDDLEGSLNEDTRYHLDVIVDASERMSTLIRDLLRFSGASQEEPEHERIPLQDLLEEVVSELELPIQESQAVIDIATLPEVEGDKGMLRQLFVNLISNSIKYRSKDRPLKITVAGMGEDLKQGLTVTDNGIGFEMEFAKKIFEPFNRLHRNKEYKGNGIGLAICSTVCEKHNWNLSAESEPNVGSTFLIKFKQ